MGLEDQLNLNQKVPSLRSIPGERFGWVDLRFLRSRGSLRGSYVDCRSFGRVLHRSNGLLGLIEVLLGSVGHGFGGFEWFGEMLEG